VGATERGWDVFPDGKDHPGEGSEFVSVSVVSGGLGSYFGQG